MEFDRNRVFTALNAEELKPGDKVIVANTIADLKEWVKQGDDIHMVECILGESCNGRFGICGMANYALAYIVEHEENCTNCGCACCNYRERHGIDEQRLHTCSRRIEHKTTEKKYRPFKDTDELVMVWLVRVQKRSQDEYYNPYAVPFIWIKRKKYLAVKSLITGFTTNGVNVSGWVLTWQELFTAYEFLDGSPCGVEE